jgi:hypothetical protein
MEMLKDPLIIARGGDFVAPDPSDSARAPTSGLERASTSRPESDRGRSIAQHAVYSTQQQLRLFKMDTVHGTVLTAIPAQAN